MIRALAFTQGHNTPSARFRVRQYLPLLVEQGLTVEESWARFGSYPPHPGWRRIPWGLGCLAERSLAALRGNLFDVVLFQREMVSTLNIAERFCVSPAILDVDDAIWLTQRNGAIDRLAEQCQLVLCGNDYIAEHFAPLASIQILPTAIDTDYWQPGDQAEDPVIVWSGSASGLPYLYEIETALHDVLESFPKASLRICSNQAPRFKNIATDRLEFVPWSPAAELAAIQSAAVGLMPMPDNEWTRGKCSFKMLTYLACRVPCVAAPWGMNRQVIGHGGALSAVTHQQWRENIMALLSDPAGAKSFGADGRHQVEERFALKKLAPVMAQAFKTLAGRAN